jgi:PAS domain S-box-containing protein
VCRLFGARLKLSLHHPISPGAPLHLVQLRADEDLVSFRRQTRRTAEQFGRDDRRTRNLAAATYEAACLLLANAGAAEAAISLGTSTELQIVISVERPDGADLTTIFAGPVEALRAGVDRLSVAQTAGSFSVLLAVALPGSPPVEMRLPAVDLFGDGRKGVSPAGADTDLAEENARLRRSLLQLQAEMQETNRGVVALYAEVHEHAERLRQAEERMRVLLDSVHDYAICMLGPEGEIVSWNAGAERLFGYSSDQIAGQNAACFYTADDHEADLPAEQLRLASEHGRFECESLRVRRGGSTFEALVLITPMRRPDRTTRGFSMVVRDITERKRLENDLRRRADELADANRAKEDFLATLSHELRTPLNAMLGWTRLLRMGKLDSAGMARALETIERNARVQEQLIADILDVSRIVTGKLRVDLRPIDLVPVVDASMDAMRPAADAKGVHLTSEIVRAGIVMGDPDRLQQVIWNLLANAIKFTPPDGAVKVSLETIGLYAEITVTDTGEGIPAALLPYVFDRFRQGDVTVTRPHGGLGLGLSIVRHIVEMHGGQVHASSDGERRGSSFSVRLPLRGLQPNGDGGARAWPAPDSSS